MSDVAPTDVAPTDGKDEESAGTPKAAKESDKQEDLDNVSLEDLKVKYWRYKKRTDEWKEKMKSIAMKERTQLTITTNQLRQNTKLLSDTTERLKKKEKDLEQVEKEKKELVQQLQVKERLVAELGARASKKPENEKLDRERLTEEITHKLEIEFRTKKLQAETQLKQQMAEMKHQNADKIAKMEGQQLALERQLDEANSKLAAAESNAQNNAQQASSVDPMQSQGFEDAKREWEKESNAKIWDLTQKLSLLEKDNSRLTTEYEQYKLRSQAAFKKTKAMEREFQHQKSVIANLEKSLKETQGLSVGQIDGDESNVEATHASSKHTEELQAELELMNVQFANKDQETNSLRQELEVAREEHRQEIEELGNSHQLALNAASKRAEKLQKQVEKIDMESGREIAKLREQLRANSRNQRPTTENSIHDESSSRVVHAAASSDSSPTSDSGYRAPLEHQNMDQANAGGHSEGAGGLGYNPQSEDFQVSTSFDFDCFVNTAATDPVISAEQLNVHKDYQLKRLGEELDAARRDIQTLTADLEEYHRSEQRHLDMEALLKEDIRKLQLTHINSAEEHWAEKKNYLKNVIWKFMQSKGQDEVQAALAVIVGNILSFSQEEIREINNLFKR